MNENAANLLLAYLHGELPPEDRQGVETLLAESVDARQELEHLRAIDLRLHTARAEEAPPTDFVDRAISRTRFRDPRLTRWRWLAIASMILLGASVALTARAWLPKPAPPAGRVFLLFLEETDIPARRSAPAEFNTALTRDLVQWAQTLRTKGQLVEARRLLDEPGWVAEPGSNIHPSASVDTGPLTTGYFMIRAADYEEANRIVRESPLQRYGFKVYVRGVR